MILADTSVWIEHFRKSLPHLPDLLRSGNLRMHPCVLGELALGSIPDRAQLLAFLSVLPQATKPSDAALLEFIGTCTLFGNGIGYVDALLLKSCLDGGDVLWTRDRRLSEQADRLGIAYEPPA